MEGNFETAAGTPVPTYIEFPQRLCSRHLGCQSVPTMGRENPDGRVAPEIRDARDY